MLGIGHTVARLLGFRRSDLFSLHARDDRVRYWTAKHFLYRAWEGWKLVFMELWDILMENLRKWNDQRRGKKAPHSRRGPQLVCTTRKSLVSKTKGSSPLGSKNDHEADDVEVCTLAADWRADEQPSTIKYSILLLAKLCASICLWVPAHVLDARLDLKPSRRFVYFNYTVVTISMVSGLMTTKFILEPTLSRTLPELPPTIGQFLQWLILSTIVSYYAFSNWCIFLFIYERHYILDFVQHRCPIISLPEKYQRRKLIVLFVAFWWLNYTGEPLFAALTVIFDVEQPSFWPYLNRGSFLLVKLNVLWATVFGAILLSTVGMIVPLTTCFLITATTKHLKNLFKKQQSRFTGFSALQGSNNWFASGTSSACPSADVGDPSERLRPAAWQPHWALANQNSSLMAHLDERTRRLIGDYSCDTLTCNWPELRCNEELLGRPRAAGGCLGARTPTRPHSEKYRMLKLRPNHPTPLSTTASSLLFVYKHIVKSLSELRGMINEYEHHFGGFHAILVVLNCFIVAIWVTVALVEARALSHQSEKQTKGGSASFSFFGLRVLFRIVSFVASNIFVFFHCNSLPQQMRKMRSQLFMMNINLARSVAHEEAPHDFPIEQQEDLYEQEDQQLSVGSYSQRTSMPTGSARRAQLKNSLEFDRIWSLYDQLARLSQLTNFKLAGGMFYGKRCLLTIFGRCVSLLLLCIQVIDMYAYL